MTVKFRSGGETYSGFVAIWTATSEPPTYPLPNGCDSCNFPFTFADTTFDTCISVQDVDTQPWCPYDYTPPANEGSHPPPKITCFESDSSCPSIPPLMVITSYPENSNQVDIKDTLNI